jgi:replication-associated recombination protein RarA
MKERFKLIQKTTFEDLESGWVKELPTSDLSIQTNNAILQYEFIKNSGNKDKIKIKPGCFTIIPTNDSCKLEETELRTYNLLETIDNTSTILNEQNKFFSRLNVYKELKREPKRSILLCSIPGVGKTSCINKVCQDALKDKNTAVIIWDTSTTRASDINSFFINNAIFTKEVKKHILVIEDIEGGTSEDDYSPRGTSTSLLNFLDGVGSPFKGTPTFIIATTNNPERSIGALIDRPGRFDKVIELKTPTEAECLQLLEFIAEKKLEGEDKKVPKLAAENEFSIAHLQEVVVRSKIDDITIFESAQQLVEHKKRFKDGFSKIPKRKMGF